VAEFLDSLQDSRSMLSRAPPALSFAARGTAGPLLPQASSRRRHSQTTVDELPSRPAAELRVRPPAGFGGAAAAGIPTRQEKEESMYIGGGLLALILIIIILILIL
jgi:hypothetical protein